MNTSPKKLRSLKGLGPRSVKQLNDIDIHTPADLEKIGPVKAFIKLQEQSNIKPSLNFLYAMVGALQNEHWVNIAKEKKGQLLLEFEDDKELENLLAGIIEKK